MAKTPVKRKGAKGSEAIAKLKKLLANKRNDLAWHHAVGRLVAQLVPEKRAHGDKRKRTYRDEKMPKLLKKLGLKLQHQGPLYVARNFSLNYSVNDLRSLEGLEYGHISILAGIKDKVTRDRFQGDCLDHKWSMRELRARIQEQIGRRTRTRRHFKEAKYIGPQVALGNMLRLQEMWEKRCAPALESDSVRLAKRMIRRPDGKFVTLVDEASAALDQLHTAVERAQSLLRKIRGTR